MNGRQQPSPLVSIITPTFNRERYLRDAVRSVLLQTFDNWELLILDDGSTDGTAAFLDTLTDRRIRRFAEPHCGNAAQARNKAIAKASGSLVAFLDSDDLWEPEKLEYQLAEFNARPECRWGFTGFKYVDDDGRESVLLRAPFMPEVRGWVLEEVLKRRVPIPATATVVQHDLLVRVGMFDESLRVGEDLDLWIKLAEVSPVTMVAKPLAKMRRHAGNHQVGILELLSCHDRIYERALTRIKSGRLRSVCRSGRIRQATEIVGTARKAGSYREARQALRRSFPYSGWHPSWYVAAAKTCLSELTSRRLLRIDRSTRNEL
ncbi:MAG TPA: glycosyltransferase [Gemmatimonadales bacterium]|nr:glycosyltransferase [Gemmatimonadales bacterium]